MAGLSPAAINLWAILSGLLLIFLVWHLYKFDRFQCLGWGDNATKSGGFKRVMTYSYLLSIPLLLFYSATLTVVKYFEGWVAFPIPGTNQTLSVPGTNITFTQPEMNIMPLPEPLWSDGPRASILALYIAFSVAWALEIVSHLEELMFWLFLMATNPPPRWTGSVYFWVWSVGSLLALAGLPVTAVLTRGDPILSEAYIFLVGASGSLLVTIVSVRVNFMFPKFIRTLREQGADAETVVRLTTYSQLNDIRIIFRFLFVLPLLILAVDGIAPGSHPINSAFFASDFLAMVGGLGCMVSSALTLLIFFPRQTFTELGYTISDPAPSSFHGGAGMGKQMMSQQEMGMSPVYPSFDRIDEWRGVVDEEAGTPPGLNARPNLSRESSRASMIKKRTSYPPPAGHGRSNSYGGMDAVAHAERRPSVLRSSRAFTEESFYTNDVKINILPTTYEQDRESETRTIRGYSGSTDDVLRTATMEPAIVSRPQSTQLRPLTLRNDRQSAMRRDSSMKDPGSPFGFDQQQQQPPRTPGGRTNPLANVPIDQMRAHGDRYANAYVRSAAARGEEVHPFLLRAQSFRSPLDAWDSRSAMNQVNRRAKLQGAV